MKNSKLQIYTTELLRLKNENKLTAEVVVKEAHDKKNPLHEYFDWEDSIAGAKWRLHQARLLINYVIEPLKDDGNRVPLFEIIQDEDSKEYKMFEEILSRNEWRNQVLKQAVHMLAYWKGKYQRYNFKELKKVASEINVLETKYSEPKKQKVYKKLANTENGKDRTERRVTIKATA
jgi:hypothetical protein